MIRTNEPALLDMELTPQMAQIMKEEFNLELEMLQGESIELEDGRTKYSIRITDPVKIEMVKEFILSIIAESSCPISDN